MVRKKSVRSAGIVVSVIVLLLAMATGIYPSILSFLMNGGRWSVLMLPLLHANIFHALINVWIFLSVIFVYRISFKDFFWLNVIGAVILYCYPGSIGLSAFIYAVIGEYHLVSRRKLNYAIYVYPFLALGFLLPSVAGMVHLVAYLSGVVYGIFNLPQSWLRR